MAKAFTTLSLATLVGCTIAGCSVVAERYQGECGPDWSQVTIGDWTLEKEVCFVRPKANGLLGLFVNLGIISMRVDGPASTQLWLNKKSLEIKNGLARVKYIQQAVFPPKADSAPDLRRVQVATIKCKSKELLGSDGNYRSISQWKKPLIARTPQGDKEDYSSPLNPYKYIHSSFCK